MDLRAPTYRPVDDDGDLHLRAAFSTTAMLFDPADPHAIADILGRTWTHLEPTNPADHEPDVHWYCWGTPAQVVISVDTTHTRIWAAGLDVDRFDPDTATSFGAIEHDTPDHDIVRSAIAAAATHERSTRTWCVRCAQFTAHAESELCGTCWISSQGSPTTTDHDGPWHTLADINAALAPRDLQLALETEVDDDVDLSDSDLGALSITFRGVGGRLAYPFTTNELWTFVADLEHEADQAAEQLYGHPVTQPAPRTPATLPAARPRRRAP